MVSFSQQLQSSGNLPRSNRNVSFNLLIFREKFVRLFILYLLIYLPVYHQNLHHHMTKREIEHFFGVDDHEKGKGSCQGKKRRTNYLTVSVYIIIIIIIIIHASSSSTLSLSLFLSLHVFSLVGASAFCQVWNLKLKCALTISPHAAFQLII